MISIDGSEMGRKGHSKLNCIEAVRDHLDRELNKRQREFCTVLYISWLIRKWNHFVIVTLI